jgi:sulfate-transporting ATPase
VIGGVGFIGGAVFGSIFVPGSIIQQVLNSVLEGFTDSITDYIVVIGGFGLIAVILQNPDGIAADVVRKKERRAAKREAKRVEKAGGAAPAEVAAPTAPPIVLEPMSSRTLEIRDLTVRFGNVEAVSHVDLEVSSGQIVGLIGPNGAGKTTLIDAVTGYVRLATGDIMLDGDSLQRRKPHARTRTGISRSFQSLELFEDLSVLENLRCASDKRDLTGYFSSLVHPDASSDSPVSASIAHTFGLDDTLERKPTELPYGRRRVVAMARSAATRPSILLLDEPAAGLSGGEVTELAGLVRKLAKEWNVGILLIEHDVDLVMSLCDEIAVLDFGRMIARGTPDEVRNDPAVRSAYLGDDIEADAAPRGGEAAATVSEPLGH